MLKQQLILFYIKLRDIIYSYTDQIIISKKSINAEIIVFGFPKSGTTAIAKLLALYGKLTHRIDPRVLWKGIRNVLQKKTNFEHLVLKNRRYFRTQLLKEPGLTFISIEVLNFFPQSHYIYVVRHPLNNIKSILNRLQLSGDLKDLTDEIYEGMDKNWKAFIKGENYGVTKGSYIETLAELWNIATEVYLSNPQRYTVVKYEDFKKDKIKSIDELAETIGVVKKQEINEHVNIQFQPKGNDVDIKAFFSDENYEIITKICQKNAKQLGYKF